MTEELKRAITENVRRLVLQGRDKLEVYLVTCRLHGLGVKFYTTSQFRVDHMVPVFCVEVKDERDKEFPLVFELPWKWYEAKKRVV